MNSCSFSDIFGFGPDLTSSEFVYFSFVKRLETSNLISLQSSPGFKLLNKQIKHSGFIPVAVRSCSLFLHIFSKENLYNFSGFFSSSSILLFLWRHSFFVQSCLISSVYISVSNGFSTCSSDGFFFDDDDDNDKTSSDLVSDSTNKVSWFFAGGLIIFLLNGTRTHIYSFVWVFYTKRICTSFPTNMFQHTEPFLSYIFSFRNST